MFTPCYDVEYVSGGDVMYNLLGSVCLVIRLFDVDVM